MASCRVVIKNCISTTILLLSLTACNGDRNESLDADTRTTKENATSRNSFLFDYGSQWKYLDTGYAPPSEWTQITFDDSDWKNGKGTFFNNYDYPKVINTKILDYEKVPEFTDSPTPSAYYFRKNMIIDDIKSVKNLYLRLIIDDAAAIFVNGKEIARSPLLDPNIELTNTTKPFEYSRYGKGTENRFILPSNAFVEGKNTIAVVVFNQVEDGSDVQFNASLTDELDYSNGSDGPYVTLNEDGTVKVERLNNDRWESQTYNSTADAEVLVELPNELGQFSVSLKSEYTAPAYTYDKPGKFFMTADIEGNIEALVFMLIQAEVMDENYNWTYGTGHLYYLGDIFDRGEYVAESLWLLYHLENQARIAGGDVHLILGNHDLMNMYGDFRYMNARYFETQTLRNKTFKEMYSKDTVLGKWLRTKNILEIAGEEVLFVHAGFNPDFITGLKDKVIDLKEVNEIGREHADKKYDKGDYKYYLPSRLYWARNIPQGKFSQAQLDDALTTIGAEKVVLGHTVFTKPTSICADKVLMVDVDHNKNFYEQQRIQAAEYDGGNYYHFEANKEKGTAMRSLIESAAAGSYCKQ